MSHLKALPFVNDADAELFRGPLHVDVNRVGSGMFSGVGRGLLDGPIENERLDRCEGFPRVP